MTRIAEFEDRQRRTLIGYTASFAIWAGALTGLMVFMDQAAGAAPVILGGLTVLFGAVWTYFLLRLLGDAKRATRDPDIKKAVSDERSKFNSMRAFAAAFWGLMAAAAFVIVVFTVFKFDSNPAAIATGVIWIGVTIALAAYLIFDR